MNSVWIGLVGVIVGGLITTLWSWLSVVRQELSDGMVAARMVDDDLASLDVLRFQDHAADGSEDDLIWKHNRAALARVLGRQEWATVSAAYRKYDLRSQDDSLHDDIAAARSALAGLVSGKRYAIGRRWRNLFG
jgi:hypothetical protein